ncbi:Nn.00g026190.m01.CDS01 [Neocucurbitaria sp. VM-36]
MAALASSRQTPAPIQQLTPPSSSHGGASWDFAVPLNNPRTSYEQEPYMSEYVTSAHSPRQPLTSQANGFAKPVRSTTWETQDRYHENSQPYLIPDRVNELHKKPSGDMGGSNSEQDGVLEYYKSHASNKKGFTGPAKAKGKKRPTKAGPADPNWAAIEHDQNNWIHRDKLKEIETRELEEAGFRVGRASRSNSRSQSATRRSRDRTNSETTEFTQNGEDRYETRKVVSPIPAEDEEAVEDYHSWSPNTYEEVAPELQPSSPRMNHTGRPSTSRIPLPRTSGIPVPSSVADRDAPLPRSRTGSANWNGDAIATNGARIRSGSVGSQALLDDPEDGPQTTPPYGHTRKFSSSGSGSPPKSPQKSPMKAKTPGKPNPTSGARKASVQKTQTKSRNTSAASPPKRPGTSGGSVSRPTTSHRPEGEAPWIATMYKPDPRLPPDQQIIPTHAKRMQQEQWENEGRVGSMYDKDFRLLNDELPDKRSSQIQPIDIERAQQNETWPLPSPIKQQPSLERLDTNAAKSPTTEQGGYKLTPTIPQGARAPSPKLAPPIDPPQPKPTTTRLREPEEEAKEKQGCCCIVM